MKTVTVGDLKKALAEYPDSTPLVGEAMGGFARVLSLQGNNNENGTLNNLGIFWWSDEYYGDNILGYVIPTGPERTLK